MITKNCRLISGVLLLVICFSCSSNEPRTIKENHNPTRSVTYGTPIEVQEPTVTSYESSIDSTVFILEIHQDYIKTKLNNESQKVNFEQLKEYIGRNKLVIKDKEILLILKKGASHKQSVGIVNFLNDSGLNKLSVVAM